MQGLISLARELIKRESITPNDGGCQAILCHRLQLLGFTLEKMPFGEVQNLWATRGHGSPLLVFAGHTDVVPPGPVTQWRSPPFQPSIRDNKLYGRGSADMKSSLAAMVISCEEFLKHTPKFQGTIGFLITSDEEGPAVDGTCKVVETLKQRHLNIDYCVVGEASSEKVFGDTIKVGRRGSLSGKLIIHGKQGHIAYPHLADNAIHRSLLPLHELIHTTWDQGNDYFPATQLQISNIHGGTGANNVIPESVEIDFNFRFSPETTASALQQQVNAILDKFNLRYDLHWHLSGNPFLTKPGKLVEAAQKVIFELTDIKPQCSTGGGTSDGRFIVDIARELIELGPVNTSIHQIDEHINIDDLVMLQKTYLKLLQHLLIV